MSFNRLQYIKEWQKANPEKVKASKLKNAEKTKEKQKQRYADKIKSLSPEEKEKRRIKAIEYYHKRKENPESFEKLLKASKKYKEKNLGYGKRYYEANKGKSLENQKIKNKSLSREEKDRRNSLAREATRIRKLNPEYRATLSAKDKARRLLNKENIKIKRNIHLKQKYKENAVYKLEILLRTGFYKAIKRKEGKKEKSIMKIIGCNQKFLKE